MSSDISILPDIEVDDDFDPDALIAREVLKDELGDMFSPEDEEFHAAAREMALGVPLKRSWDSWATYKRKKKAFKSERAPRTYCMDVNSAQDWLKRLRSKEVLTESDKNEIVSLEEMLDLKKTDIDNVYQRKEFKDKETGKVEVLYQRRRVKGQDEVDALSGFGKIQAKEVWADRVKLVHQETDAMTLHLVQMRDNREEVRQAAMQRIMELEIAGK